MKNVLETVWFSLILLTIFAFLLGYLNYINTLFVSVLLVSTFLKGQLVIDYFMGFLVVYNYFTYFYRILSTYIERLS